MNLATLLVSAAVLASSLSASAQSTSAVVFTEMGEKFTLYLNGEKQNAAPTNRLDIANLTSEFYMARVDFEDPSLGDFSHNNFAVQRGQVNNYVIRPNRKGKYILRYFPGSAPGAPTPPPAAPSASTVPAPPQPVKTGATMSTGGVTTTTTTTTTTTSSGSTEEIKVDMNVGGAGIKVDMSIPDLGGMDTEMTTTTTMSETSSSTMTTSSQLPPAQEMTVADCGISPMDFQKMKSSISGKTFEDSKETLARQIVRGKCPTSQQVHDIMTLFDFEDTRLEFAKYAFDMVSDKGNYYLVNDAFEFELTIDELEEYLQQK